MSVDFFFPEDKREHVGLPFSLLRTPRVDTDCLIRVRGCPGRFLVVVCVDDDLLPCTYMTRVSVFKDKDNRPSEEAMCCGSRSDARNEERGDG